MTDNYRKHTPFLKTVASHYCSLGYDVSNYCFVFPNRRSGQFFKSHFENCATRVTLMPEVTTITDFIGDITGDILISPIEAMFNLFYAYCEVSGNKDYEFDKFIYWGNIILNDFNDVDMYMVDAESIFRNTKELREIATDYMSAELKQAIETYFNVRFDPTQENNDAFWKQFSTSSVDENGQVKKDYLKLWQQLHALYLEYNKRIDDQGLSYNGKMMKKAVKIIKEKSVEAFNHDKYVFVGFNVLSNCELAIFDNLDNKGMAEFCWDYNSPAFEEKENKGTRFLDFYIKRFPSSIPKIEKIESFPHITVLGIPSNIGQAKYAFTVVDQWVDSKEIENAGNALDTAIVLPDERLFLPIINSVSNKVPKINVTVGFPLRDSDIVSLMRIVARLHSQATRTKGEAYYRYYREFVRDVLSHPILKSLFPKDCTSILGEIDNNNIYNVPEELFIGTGFEDLFITIHNTQNVNEVIDYIKRIIGFAKKAEALSPAKNDLTKRDDDTENADLLPLQNAFIAQYIEVLHEIEKMILKYGLPMSEISIFYLIDRLTGLYTIPFQGEPLAGLQIMGVLETRCLDFNNLIMLSMNERMFPRKFYSGSFIPTNLRKAFGMSTIEHQEAMTAYYFYRLISRAKNVCLIYDSSTQAIGSGEYSRFITQLEKVYHCKIVHRNITLGVKPTESLNFHVAKKENVLEKINDYMCPDSDARLSASSIKEFIKCPLKFYFHHVEHLNADNEESDFMDAATFGSIVHDTLQDFYYPATVAQGQLHHKVYKSQIKDFIKNKLDVQLKRNINRNYLKCNDDELDRELNGEALIISNALKRYVLNVLEYDMGLLATESDFFEIYECEINHRLVLNLEGCPPFNFTYKADRIDKINGTGPLRMIDYKTGKDETSVSCVGDLFKPDKRKVLAIFQLLIYCNAYRQEHPEELIIKPIVYKIRDMKTSRVNINKKEIEDFMEVNDEFIQEMKTLLNNFFDPQLSFNQCSEGSEVCSYCKFVEFCRR